MPAFLLTAWPYIKKFGPYVLIVLLAIGLVLHFEGVGSRRQAAKDAAQIASWKNAFNASNANFETAIGMVNKQNAAIKQLAVEGQQRAQEASEAKQAALKANKSLLDQDKQLADVAKRHYSSAEPCTTPTEVMKGKQI